MDKPPHDPVNYELRPGDLEGDYKRFLDTLTDVPESPSLQPLNIDEAGITNQQAYIQLQDIEGKGLIKPVLCDIQIGATLHGHRGIHMSRCEEALFDVSKEVHPSIDHFAVALARAVRDKQGSRGSVVKVNGLYLHTHMTHATKRESHDKMYLLSDASVDGDREQVSTGVRAYNITACPCTRTYTKYSVVPALREKGFNLEQIQDILNITLTGTHTQRGTISVVIDKTHEDITTGELYKILDQSAHLVFELLKRPDEHDLVVRALKRPQFTEDVARETAVNAYRRFGQVAPDDTRIEVESILNDSIHIHDVRTKIVTSIAKLGAALNP
jgi:GTP cyclohydrolase IV